MTTIFEVLFRKAQPYKVSLMRGQKGTYAWEVTVSSENYAIAHSVLEAADRDLRARFATEQAVAT